MEKKKMMLVHIEGRVIEEQKEHTDREQNEWVIFIII